MNKKLIQSLTILIIMIITMQTPSFLLSAEASSQKIPLNGLVYVLDEDSDYDIDASVPSNNTDYNLRIGSLSIDGNINRSYETNEIPSYEIAEGEIFSLSFSYISSLKNANKDDWHLVEDGDDTVNGSKLEDDIDLGALLFQTSFDGKKWVDCKSYVDVSKDVKFGNEQINDIQLSNGCYYRVIAAFKVERRTKENWGFIPDDYDSKKIAQVYTFYAQYKSTENNSIPQNVNSWYYSDRVFAGDDDGYTKTENLEIDDPHYGWKIGSFTISGYTRKDEKDGIPVFIKNAGHDDKKGDIITLWFKLEQDDLNKLNNNSDLRVAEDTNGYDQHFEIKKTNFGRGALIIRQTDDKNVKSEPIIYTDFLAALCFPGADTKIKLFEEGDYEVALDYQVNDGSDENDYRIYFEFKIRNGSAMGYLFDLESGNEIGNKSFITDGFKVDLAGSKYLNIYVQRMIYTTNNGLYSETKDTDTRYSRPATNGEEFKDEGLYTIEFDNPSTGKSEKKELYVGSDPIIIASRNPANSKLSINEIAAKVYDGATISEDGTIIDPPPKEAEAESSSLEENDTDSVVEAAAETSLNETDNNSVVSDNSVAESEKKLVFPIVPVAAGAGGVLVIVLIGAVFRKTKGGKKNE